MTERQWRDARRAFVNGESDKLRLGGYGGTVTVRIVAGGIRLETTRPRRRQRMLRPNSRTMRELAVRAVETVFEKLQGLPSKRRVEAPPPKPRQAGLITPRDVWLAYLRRRLGSIPEEEVLGWGRGDVVAHLKRLSPSARRAAGSPNNIYSVILAARRLHRDGVVPLDADIETIQPGALDAWAMDQLGRGASPHTVTTYRGRFQAAVRRYMEAWPHEWGDRIDPTRGVCEIPTEHIRPPEIGEDRAARLLAALRARGEWRALATAMIVHATARRVGSVSGARVDLHLDAPPLCANDFRRAEDGVLEVVWRADAQKGNAYGRGDVVQPATRQLELAYRWLTRFHPNPLGPKHPLIWSADDPTRAESYDRLNDALAKAWRAEFGEQKPKGLAWHGFCRTTITTLADELGILTTAEYAGRSPKMVERIYKRARRETAKTAARRLDQIRRARRLKRTRAAEERLTQSDSVESPPCEAITDVNSQTGSGRRGRE